MDKQEITALCKSLGFKDEEYCLSYGGAMVLHGIKASTPDIDINVTKELFDRLAVSYKVDYAMFNEPFIKMNDKIEIFIGEDISNSVYVDGIPIAALEDILAAKKRLNRAKDLEDIRKIEFFIENENKE